MKSKSRYVPFFNDDADSFNPKEFCQGGLYRISQVVKDESLVGTKLVVYYVNFCLKSGETCILKPKIVEYSYVKWCDEVYINLTQVSDGRTIHPDFYKIVRACVWSYENLDLALVDYNHKIETIVSEREKYLTGIMEKELKRVSKNIVKRI